MDRRTTCPMNRYQQPVQDGQRCNSRRAGVLLWLAKQNCRQRRDGSRLGRRMLWHGRIRAPGTVTSGPKEHQASSWTGPGLLNALALDFLLVLPEAPGARSQALHGRIKLG